MNDRAMRRYDKFGREIVFGNENAADFAVGSDAKTHFAKLAAVVDKLSKAKAGQQPGSATPRSVLLDALRLDVQNIARMARAMDQDAPGSTDKFRLPKSGSDQDLLTAALNIARAAIAVILFQCSNDVVEREAK